MGEHKTSFREIPPRTNYEVGGEGLSLADVGESTGLLASRLSLDGATPTRPVVPPVYNTSNYILNQPEDLMKCNRDGGNCYSSIGNPTVDSLEAAINVLERGAGSLTFASGMGAISTVFLTFLKKEDHLNLFDLLAMKFGLEITKVRNADFSEVVKSVRPNTKMIWIETPCNPAMFVVDIRQMAEFARSKDIMLAVDASFAGPYAQKTIDLGADFSVHSCSKYMGGHADLVAGCVTTRTVEQWQKLKLMQIFTGNVLSPQVGSLLHRSLKTLRLRMIQISENALKVSQYLEQHPKVKRVAYPGLPSHPQHELASKQMREYSGMIMVEVEGGGQGGRTVLMNVKIFKIAVSLGSVDSIIQHPYSMTHGPALMTDEQRAEAGITPGMIRISVGLEDAEDLIRDLDLALAKVVV